MVTACPPRAYRGVPRRVPRTTERASRAKRNSTIADARRRDPRAIASAISPRATRSKPQPYILRDGAEVEACGVANCSPRSRRGVRRSAGDRRCRRRRCSARRARRARRAAMRRAVQVVVEGQVRRSPRRPAATRRRRRASTVETKPSMPFAPRFERPRRLDDPQPERVDGAHRGLFPAQSASAGTLCARARTACASNDRRSVVARARRRARRIARAPASCHVGSQPSSCGPPARLLQRQAPARLLRTTLGEPTRRCVAIGPRRRVARDRSRCSTFSSVASQLANAFDCRDGSDAHDRVGTHRVRGLREAHARIDRVVRRPGSVAGGGAVDATSATSGACSAAHRPATAGLSAGSPSSSGPATTSARRDVQSSAATSSSDSGRPRTRARDVRPTASRCARRGGRCEQRVGNVAGCRTRVGGSRNGR